MGNMDGRFSRIIRFITAESLRLLRKYYSGKTLAKIVKIPDSTLSRYANMDIIPSLDTSLRILNDLDRERLLEKVLERVVRVDEYGVVNVYSIAYDMGLISLAAFRLYKHFHYKNIDVVLTAAANGVPLATLSAYLLGARLAVAKKEKDPTVLEIMEETIRNPQPPFITSLFLPKFSLRKNDRVLIVDDLLQSGRTLRGLQRFVEKSNASIVGVYALISVGDLWMDSLPRDAETVIVLRR